MARVTNAVIVLEDLCYDEVSSVMTRKEYEDTLNYEGLEFCDLVGRLESIGIDWR